jgi:hypothetical protein
MKFLQLRLTMRVTDARFAELIAFSVAKIFINTRGITLL